MQFIVLIAWLCISNAVLMIPAVVLLEYGQYLWAGLLVIGLPAARIARRFRGPRGYYVLGYNDGVGGDINRSARWINRHERPQWFTLLVAIEIIIVVILAVSMFARGPKGDGVRHHVQSAARIPAGESKTSDCTPSGTAAKDKGPVE